MLICECIPERVYNTINGSGPKSPKPEMVGPEELSTLLASERSNTLLQAVQAAFGDAEETEPLEPESAKLAEQLWQHIPTKIQRDLRDQLLEIPPTCWTPRALHAHAESLHTSSQDIQA